MEKNEMVMQLDAKHQIIHIKLMSNHFVCGVCMQARVFVYDDSVYYFSNAGNVYGVDLGNVFNWNATTANMFSVILFLILWFNIRKKQKWNLHGITILNWNQKQVNWLNLWFFINGGFLSFSLPSIFKGWQSERAERVRNRDEEKGERCDLIIIPKNEAEQRNDELKMINTWNVSKTTIIQHCRYFRRFFDFIFRAVRAIKNIKNIFVPTKFESL